MASFNPTVAPGNDSNGESAQSSDQIPSGDYLIRAVWFDRKENGKKDGEYLRIKWEILAGPHANTAFFANLSCKVHVDGVASRWRSICKGLGVEESFEVGGEKGDKDFARLIKGRPFRARVGRSTSGEYVNYDIQKTYTKDTWSEGEQKAVKELADTMLGQESEAASVPKPDDDIPF